jgi:hypothetical protein
MKGFIKTINKTIATVLGIAIVTTSGLAVTSRKVLAYNAGIEAFVNSLYSDCLGRSADPTGFNDWCNKLATGQITGKQAAYGFFFSPEFQAKANAWSDTELINAYYKVFLNRSADPTGAAYWANQIAGTTNDISILFTGFADSTEFASKCASYGVTVGPHINVPTTVRGSAGSSSGSTGGGSGLAAQTNGARASSIQELDAYWTSQGFEIFYIDLGNGNSQKCYVRWLDTTDHNNQVNAWRNQNGQPSLAIISDPNDARYQDARTRAVEVAYMFSHRSPWCIAEDVYGGPHRPAGGVGENIHSGTTAAFEAFRNSALHNGTMVYRGTAMATAACQVAFVQPDGVSTYYDRGRGGFYSPSTGSAEATVQVFYE